MAALITTTREVGQITMVDLSGRIALGEGSALLRKTIRDLLEGGRTNIILNLGDINYIDSSGIGELMTTYTSVKNQGGELKLLNLHKNVRNLLQVTRLYTVFDVQEDLNTAIRAFA